MNSLLMSLILLTPLVIAASGWYRHSKWSLVVASAVPLISSLMLANGSVVTVEWLLLGSQFGLNDLTQWLLPATALVWLAAALHNALASVGSIDKSTRLFFLLTMSGNLILLLAQDALTFYVGYALMGLSGYGLVYRHRSSSARVAAKTYLRWTIAGELLLFSGLLAISHQAGSTALPFTSSTEFSTWSLLLVIAGFGIKIGMPGLHAWMPGAYSSSTTIGSAVFSGAMANAGILGMLLFLPLQQPGYDTAGLLLLVMGLIGAAYGVLMGLPQRNPKVILAYSSMSQLSTLAALIGMALLKPQLAPALVIAIVIYALHHGLTKAALFLALDGLSNIRFKHLSVLMLGVLSLIMAGLPFTSGDIAKTLSKQAIPKDYEWLLALLTLGSILTALLMSRFVYICATSERKQKAISLGAALGMSLLLLVIAHMAMYLFVALPDIGLKNLLPLGVALVLISLFLVLPETMRSQLLPVTPKGDILNLLTKVLLRKLARISNSTLVKRLNQATKMR